MLKRPFVLAAIASLALHCGAHAQSASSSLAEQRTVRAFDIARNSPLSLHAFLAQMPKGGDLHMHLSGAIYAETFIRDAVEDHLCVDPAVLSFVKPAGVTHSNPPLPMCGAGKVPAANAFTDQKLYDALVDSFSMRSFVPSAGVSGHDQFFATFARFSGIDKRHDGDWLDEVATRAAAQNEQYLEIMETPDFSHAAAMGYEIGWKPDMQAMRDALLAKGLKDDVPAIRKEFDEEEATRNQREHCGHADATSACKIAVRYLFQILRGFPRQQVFAQTLLGFETVMADPRLVGINFVMPEDGYVSMTDYHLQMQMLDYLHSVYPKVHISLHAGEVAPGLVTPDGLRFHIREAVELGHAERIGHGVDVMYEDHPYELLKEMASRHVMVEINITSNDVILGITGKQHPLMEYRNAHVPVALSTDDEGVSRIDLTHEYVRAVTDFGLGYLDLKNMARTSLEHSFLAGPSLWAQPDAFTRTDAACTGQTPSAEKPTEKCAEFLKSSDKAAQQWELEARFRAFEAGQR